MRGQRAVPAVKPETRVWLLRGKAQPQIWRHPISFAAERRAVVHPARLPIIVSRERRVVNPFDDAAHDRPPVVREDGLKEDP